MDRKQLKDFWSDLNQLGLDESHYTGVLTLENVPPEVYNKWDEDTWIIKSKNYEPFFVVDGQQRLTTAIILVQVIVELMSSEQKVNYSNREEIKKKFVFDSKDKGTSRSYIFGYEKDNPSYNYLKNKIFMERIDDKVEETTYTQNLLNAKSFFTKELKGVSIEDLEVTFKKVTQSLLFNIFTISKEVDVCVAFETMNNRGKPLSYLELLKNRLIYLSLKFDEEDFEREKLRKAINVCWRAIYHSLGKNKNRPLDDDKFLLAHFLMYYESNENNGRRKGSPIYHYSDTSYAQVLLDKKFVLKNLLKGADEQDRVTLGNVYHYVQSLQDSVEVWYNIFNPVQSGYGAQIKEWLEKLVRLGADGYLPLLLVVMKKVENDRQKITFLKAIERNIFLHFLYAPYWASLDVTYVDYTTISMARDIDSGRLSIDKAIKTIHEQHTEKANKISVDYIVSKFRNNGFYRWKLIRYFLFEYNLSLQGKARSSRKKIDWPVFVEDREDFISVEHIYPQTSNDSYWREQFRGYTTRNKSALKNSLGNLLPLSVPKNSSLSNKTFSEKSRGKRDNYVSYAYGSYAENEVSRNEDWGASMILERGLKMLEFLEERWAISLGREENKISILNLGFVQTKAD